MSPGRYSSCRKFEESNLNFYPKRHQARENQTSVLINRDTTFMTKGVGHFMDKDLDKLNYLNEAKNRILSDMQNMSKEAALVKSKDLK